MAIPGMHDALDAEAEKRRMMGLPPVPQQAMPATGAPVVVPRPQLPAAAPAALPAPVAMPRAADPGTAAYVRSKLAASGGAEPQLRRPSQSWMAMVADIIAGPRGRPGTREALASMDARAERDFDRKRAEEDANPASERSARARAAAGPMLKRLGLDDDEIAGLSAADIGGMTRGGNLATSLAEARQRAAAAKAKAEADAEADAAKRTAEAAEFDRRNAITSPQLDRRAALIGGMATDRQVQAALLGDELRRRAAAENDERDAANRAAAAAAEEERRVAAELRKAEAAEAKEIEALETMEARLKARNDPRLPGQKGIIDTTVNKGVAYVAGGTGMSDEDSRLDNDLTALGLQAYMNTAGNAPNSEREQDVANRTFRGDGSTASAIAAIQARKQQLARMQEARRATAQGNRIGERPRPKPAGGTPGRKDLGGVRIRDPKTGRTGTYPGTAAEAKAEGYEVIDG